MLHCYDKILENVPLKVKDSDFRIISPFSLGSVTEYLVGTEQWQSGDE